VAEPIEKLSLVRNEPPEVPRFGKYEVLSKIGTGGMAEVFKCRLSGIGGFDKVVVVKRMLPDLIGDKELVRMFLDEARIVANLSHPNIVQIFEINQHQGIPFIAMEYVRGPTLARVITESWKQGKPCARVVAKVLSEIASGLAYAHEARDPHGEPLNIVHRDVTPHNVVVSTEGVAKLLDFGVAKASGRLSKTESGNIKGKFRYMAPEQLKVGAGVDGRADVFAVGASLYLAATGAHAYPGRNDLDVLKAAAAGAYRPPSQVRREIDPELERIILWAMAPRLEVRCPNAMALYEVLDAYVSRGENRITNHHVGRFLAHLFGDLSNSGALGGAYNDEVVSSKDYALSGADWDVIRDSSKVAAPPAAPSGPEDFDVAKVAAPRPAPVPARARPMERPAPQARRASTTLVAALAAVALLAIGVIAVLWAKRSSTWLPERAQVASDAIPNRSAPEVAAPPQGAPQEPAPEPARPEPAPTPVAERPPPTPALPSEGRLTVVTDAPARVLIDGEFVGTSPVRARALAAARHQIEVQAYGFPPQRQGIVIAPEKEIQLAFHFSKRHPEPPAVRIAPSPSPAAPSPAAAGAARSQPSVAVAAAEASMTPAPTPAEPVSEPRTASVPVAPLPAPPPTPVARLEPARVVEVVRAPSPAVAPPTPAPAPQATAGDGPISSCPEGASLAGKAPPAGNALWCQLPSGVKHGKYLRWYANGKRAEIGEFVNGKKNGRWLEFYEDGSEREKTEWRRGVKTW
jgi:serine/threonine protein kinase